ncbi:MAG: Mur ligase family protein, partial [Gaiellales bacterium]
MAGSWVSLVDSAGIELDALAEVVPSARVVGPAGIAVTDVVYDHRAVTEGALFACVPGYVVDGHDCAQAAVDAGAAAVVVERELDIRVPQLVVPSTRAALGVVADAFFEQPSRDLTVVGVTGTNGKTTTTFLVHAILAADGRRPGLLGTIERRIGGERWASRLTTAESVDIQRDLRAMTDAGDRSCVMEVSSHAVALDRLRAVRFDALVFANLGRDHLDFHGDLESYFRVKRQLFVETDIDGRRPPAVVNLDDPWGQRLASDLAALGEPPLTFGRRADADVVATDVRAGLDGTRLRVGTGELDSPLRGEFNVENILAAAAVARLLGIQDDTLARGVGHVRGVPGRFETVDAGQPFTVIVDYAHTP